MTPSFQITESDIGAYGGDLLVIYDNDDDGFDNSVDCDDDDPNTHPEAEEVWYDGLNQNCDIDPTTMPTVMA